MFRTILLSLLLLANCPAFSQVHSSTQFGQPIKAADDKGLLQLDTVQPPRELAKGAEVIYIYGYQAKEEGSYGTRVNVEIDRPNAKVLLILSSYENVYWNITASPSTKINGILVSSNKTSSVITDLPVKGYSVKMPSARQTDSRSFQDLMNRLNDWFGIAKIDAFRGMGQLPHSIRISELDPPGPELTHVGYQPTKPEKNLKFDLVSTDYKKVRWTLTGPEGGNFAPLTSPVKIAISPSGKELYQLASDGLAVINLEKNTEIADTPSSNPALNRNGSLQDERRREYERMIAQNKRFSQGQVLPLPFNFPAFSHPMDIAYDTKRDLVTVVTLGGEGFLYRLDAKKSKWVDFRSLNNVDMTFLAYDQVADRYAAWTSNGELLMISGDGNVLFSRKIGSKLPGFLRSYSGGHMTPVVLVPQGDNLVVVHFSGNTVEYIWNYQIEKDAGIMSYKKN